MGPNRGVLAREARLGWGYSQGQPGLREWRSVDAAQWKDLPAGYGNWKSVHKRFTRWARSGIWEKLFRMLLGDPDNRYVMIDSTIVRDRQQAGGGKGWPK